MELIDHLKWRYATKKFDPQQKVSSQDMDKIKEAVQLSASSYGLQLYKVLIIEDSEVRAALRPASWGQQQITDASHLFVFCNYANVLDGHINDYMRLKSNVQGLDVQELKGYGDFVKNKMNELSAEEQKAWTARQTYIALANLLTACAELKIDACPMEGFDPEEYDRILGLSEDGLSAAVLATVGYRSVEDKTQHARKVRKPFENLFEHNRPLRV